MRSIDIPRRRTPPRCRFGFLAVVLSLILLAPPPAHASNEVLQARCRESLRALASEGEVSLSLLATRVARRGKETHCEFQVRLESSEVVTIRVKSGLRRADGCALDTLCEVDTPIASFVGVKRIISVKGSKYAMFEGYYQNTASRTYLEALALSLSRQSVARL